MDSKSLLIVDDEAGMDGLEALRRMRERTTAMPIGMMTAYGTIESDVDAIKAGAQDFVAKPLDWGISSIPLTKRTRKLLALGIRLRHILPKGNLLVCLRKL